MRKITLILINCIIMAPTFAQTGEGPLEWWFWPDYTLKRNANNPIGPRITAPYSPINPVSSKTYPFVFFGQDPTDRIHEFAPSQDIPVQEFSVEKWLLYHVNQDVGCFTAYRNKFEPADPEWLIGIFGKELVFSLKGEDTSFSSVMSHKMKERGWKNYWIHVVGTFNGTSMKLYINGEQVDEMKVGKVAEVERDGMMLETAAYLSNEPYMQLGDLLKNLRIHDRALSTKEINSNYQDFQTLVEMGKLYPDLFHYTAGPYLQMATPTSMGIMWETSEPATHTLEYWKAGGERQSMEINRTTPDTEITNPDKLITKAILNNLEPGQPYFYEITSRAVGGDAISSGVLTFKTADERPESFTFSVIGDTEARPHVNNRVSKLLWDERPDFLLNLGDLTDGGRKNHKFQWNYEYFYGMNQLTSRIPVFPVAGNGEGDLYWFSKYHILPEEDKGFYKFSYGNADFFMMDSNQKDAFSAGEDQYAWLEKELSASKARWKFVAHHHAPYSSDENDYGNTWETKGMQGDPKIKKIIPLYEKYNVDIVFFGHLHTYQRTHRINKDKIAKENGVMYIQAGGAGGNLEDFAPTRSWFSAKTFRGHHYLTVEILQHALELRMYDSEGRMKDIVELSKFKTTND